MEKIGEFLASLPEELYVFLISILPVVELRGAIPVGAALGLPFYINYPLAIVGNMLPVPFILLFIPKILDFLARYKIFRPLVDWLRKRADRGSKRVLKDGYENSIVTDTSGGENGAARSVLCEEKATVCTDECEKNEAACSHDVKKAEHDGSVDTNEAALAKYGAEAAIGKEAMPASECNSAECNGDNPQRRPMSAAIFTALMFFVAVPLPGTGAWTGALVASLFNFPRRRSLASIFFGVLISGAVMTLASYGVVGFLSFLL